VKRRGFLKRRTPLRPKHRASLGDVLVLMHHFGTDPRCVFPDCDKEAEDLHHVKPKGRGGSDELANIKPLCRRHHRWVHENPNKANEMGLLIHSWQEEAG
jgi:5-methylcytosine-specific restriction endonuclease McrA